MARRLVVEIVGDSRSLERSLQRSTTSARQFDRTISKKIGGTGTVGAAFGLGPVGKAGFIGAGALAASAGIKQFVDAARNAQVILGQTGVAVQGAGLNWNRYASQVDAASKRISKASAFDDEAVLQSFQVFVRGQKDVAKSLQLAQLAADVGRGRYTDLASATQLVNKAAMGQIGALRRAGIFIDKNATATQALAALQQTYGGAATKYANSSAGAADKLSVAWENLSETAGGPLANGLALVVDDLTVIVDKMNQAAKISIPFAGSLGGIFKDAARTLPFIGTAISIGELIRGKPGKPVIPATGQVLFGKGGNVPVSAVGALTGRLKPAATPGGLFGGARVQPVIKGLSTALQLQEVNARLGGNQNVLKGVLAKEAQFLSDAITNSFGLKPADKLKLKQALLGVTEEIRGIDAQITSDANDKAQAAKDQRDKLAAAAKAAKAKVAAAHKRTLEALKKQAQAFKQQADDIKSAVLDSFDTKQAKVNNARALADAKQALKQARILGGPEGIKLALRDYQDAQRAIVRQRLEDTKFRVTAGPPGATRALQVGNVTINISGAGDPDAIAKKVIAAIDKQTRRTAGSRSGRQPGYAGPH